MHIYEPVNLDTNSVDTSAPTESESVSMSLNPPDKPSMRRNDRQRQGRGCQLRTVQ